MKPGPEHVGRRFRHLRTGVIVAYAGKHIGGEKEVISTAYAGPMVLDAELFDRDFELLQGMPELTAAGDEFPVVTPSASPIPALLSRLLAAGFEDVELALRSTRDSPAPTYRLIGYRESERISYTQIAADEGDLGRIEAAVMEKLEALKAERAAKGES